MKEAEVEVEELEMTVQIGVTLAHTDPTLHFARCLGALVWPPEHINP